MSWFRGLRSLDYTADILREKHGLATKKKILKCAKLITAHADSAVDLLEQAFSGASRVSFLPVYYGMLDLAKIVTLTKGWTKELHEQRAHGITWSGINRASQDLLTDHIVIHDRGAFALFYKAIVGKLWPKSAKKNKQGQWISTCHRKIYMRDIYPYIGSIGFEYGNAYNDRTQLYEIEVNLVQYEENKFRIEISFQDGELPEIDDKRRYGILTNTHKDGEKYISRSVNASNWKLARKQLERDFRFFLLYPECYSIRQYTLTPNSCSNFLMPEEIPCLLSFFHMGSVVRYDPERLARLYDSKACAMLENLRTHGTYDYLIAVWSYLMQRQVFPVAT